ncbi:MAG: hypothetical protein AWT59_3330, partial [Candidatus Gallionella acididurans]
TAGKDGFSKAVASLGYDVQRLFTLMA